MTREEAKHIVDVAFGVPQAVRRSGEDRTYHEDEIREAKEMAIQALSQEPDAIHNEREQAYKKGYEDASKKYRKEPCEDTISRTELLKAIDTWDRFSVDDTNSLFRLDNLSLPHYVPYIHYDDVVKCIKGMPSVTPKQKMGHWIHPYRSDIACECSFCHVQMPITNDFHYCPNCGAKMV